jgi:hypothetical protein
MSKFQTETLKRIYDERFQDMYFEIGSDADTGEAVEIRVVSITHNELLNTHTPTIVNRVAFDPDMIPELIEVLNSFRKVQ